MEAVKPCLRRKDGITQQVSAFFGRRSVRHGQQKDSSEGVGLFFLARRFPFPEPLNASGTDKPQIALDNLYPYRYNANVPIGVWKGAVYDERST